MKKTFLIIFCSIQFISTLSGQEIPNKIVVLNSLNNTEVTTSTMFNILEESYNSQFGVGKDILYSGITLEHNPLDVPTIRTLTEVDSIKQMLLDKYPSPPKMIVCIGDPSWLVCRDLFRGVWKDVPTIVCYSAGIVPKKMEDLLDKRIVVDSNTITMSKMVEGTNTLLMELPFYPKENIELMYSIIPQMKKMVFISDDRHISQIARLSIQRSLENDFPRLKYKFFTTAHISTQALLDSLHSYDKNVGVLYYSWLVYKKQESENYLDTKMQNIISSLSTNPIFLYQDLREYNDKFAGGYFILLKEYADRVVKTMINVIEGAKLMDVNMQNVPNPKPILNYNYLQTFKIDENLYPSDAVYFNEPPTIFHKYKYFIFAVLLIIALIIWLTVMKIRLISFQKKESEKDKNTSKKYIEIIENLNKRYYLAIHASKMNSWVFDVESGIIDNNCEYMPDERLKTVFERCSFDKFLSMVYPDDILIVKQTVHKILAGTTEQESFLCRIKNPLNLDNIIWTENYIVVSDYDNTGKPVKFVGTTINISEKIIMQDNLQKAKADAYKSNVLKSEFLANMSHEIRTPLNAIVGFSEILTSVDDKSEKESYLQVIENNNILLLQLMSDILDLSKIETDTLEFIYSGVDLTDVFSQIEKSWRARIVSKEVSLVFENNCIPVITNTDRNKIIQVITNFISNAIKFTNRGSIRFGYELRGKNVYCYVKDTGVGISNDRLDFIFGKSMKLESSGGGVEIGLLICEYIVKSLGGKIGVESILGEGSNFWFTIPYEPMVLCEKINVSKPEKLYTIEKGKATVLIAEDDESNYLLFESILRKEFDIIHAWNGEEALNLFNEHNPHIVLMDIKMPIMNGYDALKEIRKISPKVPIIAVTAFAFEEDTANVMKNGFSGYIPKPINSKELRAKMFDLLNQRFYFTTVK